MYIRNLRMNFTCRAMTVCIRQRGSLSGELRRFGAVSADRRGGGTVVMPR